MSAADNTLPVLVVVTDPYTERPGYQRYARPAPPEAAPHVTYCGT